MKAADLLPGFGPTLGKAKPTAKASEPTPAPVSSVPAGESPALSIMRPVVGNWPTRAPRALGIEWAMPFRTVAAYLMRATRVAIAKREARGNVFAANRVFAEIEDGRVYRFEASDHKTAHQWHVKLSGHRQVVRAWRESDRVEPAGRQWVASLPMDAVERGLPTQNHFAACGRGVEASARPETRVGRTPARDNFGSTQKGARRMVSRLALVQNGNTTY